MSMFSSPLGAAFNGLGVGVLPVTYAERQNTQELSGTIILAVGRLRMWLTLSHGVLFRWTDGKTVSQPQYHK